jgi:hypothetical protein
MDNKPSGGWDPDLNRKFIYVSYGPHGTQLEGNFIQAF